MAEKKAFASIREIEVQIDAAHKRRQQTIETLMKEYLQAREPLLQRRFEIVTGRSEPTDDELQGFKPQGAAAAAPAAKGAVAASSTGSGSGGKGTTSGGGGGTHARNVPFFWLNALCNEETLGALITPRDRCALEYLEDIRYETGPMGLSLEFHFAPNPFFHNKVLRKGTFVQRRRQAAEGEGDAASALGPRGIQELVDEVISWRDEHTIIDWKPGRSLLVKAQPAAAAADGSKKKKKMMKAAAPASAAATAGAGKAGKAGKQAGGGAGGSGKQGKKGGGGAASSAAAPSRSKRHHGKHLGPAPDLPDPEEEDGEEAGEQRENEAGKEMAAEEEEDRGWSARRQPCPSFFRFFLPLNGGRMHRRKKLDPSLESDDDDKEEGVDDAGDEGGNAGGGGQQSQRQQHQRVQDAEVLDVIVRRVIPRAVHLYLAAGPRGASAAGKASSRAGGVSESGVEEEEEDAEEGYQLVSGNPAGDVASLALGAQKALHVLVALQRHLDELAAGLKRGEWEAWVALTEEVARLAARRRTLLVGPAGTPGPKLSIPAFWLRALRAAPTAALLVQHRDERALSYLADVRLVWDTSRMPTSEDPTRKMDLELEFLPNNPYFTNGLLRKRFTFHAPGGSLTRMWVAASQSDPIVWQPGRDLTTKSPPRQGQGQSAAGGRGGRARKVPSFFAFFDDNPGALVRAFGLPGGQSAAAQQESVQAQEEFLVELINHLVPFAGLLASQSTVDPSDLGDEQEDDDDDEETEEDEENEDGAEEEDGEAAASRRATKKAAAAAARRHRRGGGAGGGVEGGGASSGGGGGFGLLRRLFSLGGSAGVLMAVLFVTMMLAQLLLFMDSLDHVRGRFPNVLSPWS